MFRNDFMQKVLICSKMTSTYRYKIIYDQYTNYIFVVCLTTHQHVRLWISSWIPGPKTPHTTIGIAQLADHGLHGWVRSCGTPDSMLLTHGLSLTTGQHGGRYDPQPVTRSSEWVSIQFWLVECIYLYSPYMYSLWYYVSGRYCR